MLTKNTGQKRPARSAQMSWRWKKRGYCSLLRLKPGAMWLVEGLWTMVLTYSGLLLIGVMAERITIVMPFHLFLKRRQAAMETVALPRVLPSHQQRSRLPASVEIYGRRYLCEVPYVLPKDRTEGERLDFQHFLLRHMLGSNYLAPLEQLTISILDVGCGTGRWCREMARQFPYAQVVGLDLEELPDGPAALLPPNYRFVSGNVLHPLPFAHETFDYVHQRLLVAAIPLPHWPGVISELIRVTRPGGWLELVEAGTEFTNPGPLTRRFLAWGIAASTSRGLDARGIPHLGEMMHASGLHAVQKRSLAIPIGAWAGRPGIMMKENLLSAMTGLKALYTRGGIAEDEFTHLLTRLPDEWESYRSSYHFFIFYARK